MYYEVIDKHQRFLCLISTCVRLLGLLILFSTLFVIILPILFGAFSGGWPTEYVSKIAKQTPRIISNILLPAFLLLGIDQFIKNMLKKDIKSNWIIKHADGFIYVYMIFLFSTFLYNLVASQQNAERGCPNDLFVLVIFFAISIISIFAKMLLWLALALILRRIVPLIEECKTII